MANELQPLSLLFQNRLFRIPDYQRGYAWLQQQLVDFWDDLVNLQTDRYHYTGLLSLKPLKGKETISWGEDLWLVENGYKPCHIVDGQQRITTFVILLNEIVGFVRSLDENKGKSDRESNYQPFAIYKEQVLKLLADTNMTQSKKEDLIVALFAYVQGLTTLATMENVHYAYKWEDKLTDLIGIFSCEF